MLLVCSCSWVNTVLQAQQAVAALPEVPPGTPPNLVLADTLTSPMDAIAQRFQQASAAGFTALRLFGFGGDDPGAVPLETSPGRRCGSSCVQSEGLCCCFSDLAGLAMHTNRL